MFPTYCIYCTLLKLVDHSAYAPELPVSISAHREFGAKREILIDGILPESIERGRLPVFTVREIKTKISMLKAINYSVLQQKFFCT